jgi:hypothetical protein
MLKIQRRAGGLLSSLGIVGTGDTPNALAEIVSPTMDIQLFYDAGRHENEFVTTAGAAAVGNNAQITVPAGEVWRLVGCSARYFMGGAGAAPSMWVGIRFVVGGTNTILGSYVENAIALVANEEAQAVGILTAPILLGPGAQIVAQLASAGVAGSNLTVVATVVKFAT